MHAEKLKSNFRYTSYNVYIFFVLLFLVQLLLYILFFKKEDNLILELTVFCSVTYVIASISIKKVVIRNDCVTLIYFLRLYQRKVIIPYNDIKKVKYVSPPRSPNEWYIFPKNRIVPYFFTTSHLMSKNDLQIIFNFLKENGIEIIVKGKIN